MNKMIFFHILDLNLKSSYQIASLFYMYIDMGERIAGKQDRPSLIIEGPQQAPPPNSQKCIFYSHILDFNSKLLRLLPLLPVY